MFTLPRSGEPAAILQWATETVRQLRLLENAGGSGAGDGGTTGGVPGGLYPGSIVEWAGVNEPDGWAFCDGRLLEIEIYPDLFANIGYSYGQLGDDPDFVRIPDLREKFSAWYGAELTGGQDSVVLTTANLPALALELNDPGHSHGVTDPGHVHEVRDWALKVVQPGVDINELALAPDPALIETTEVVTGVSVNAAVTGITIDGGGISAPIDNRPAFYSLPRIIKL